MANRKNQYQQDVLYLITRIETKKPPSNSQQKIPSSTSANCKPGTGLKHRTICSNQALVLSVTAQYQSGNQSLQEHWTLRFAASLRSYLRHKGIQVGAPPMGQCLQSKSSGTASRRASTRRLSHEQAALMGGRMHALHTRQFQHQGSWLKAALLFATVSPCWWQAAAESACVPRGLGSCEFVCSCWVCLHPASEFFLTGEKLPT